MTLTVSVKRLTRAAGTPGGPVIFMDGGTELGSVELQDGKATLTTSALHLGSNVVKAEYSPAGSFRASSATVVEKLRTPRSRPRVALQREAARQAISLVDAGVESRTE